MAAIRAMTTLNDKPLTAIREVGSVHALTDVTGMSSLTRPPFNEK
jgi:selenophosphate synthase